MSGTLFDVQAARRRFSSLQGDFVFLDAPGGSQVPDEVGEAIARALREASANIGALYETSHRVERIIAAARDDAARFLNCSAEDVIFGQNMTVLDFALSRTAARDWREGDRVLVSRLDHDAGVSPWVELANDRGFEVDWIDVTDDLHLDYDDLERKLDDRVRVVACVASSNAVGTIIDVARVAELAHSVGALLWVDAVQFAAHEPVDVGLEDDRGTVTGELVVDAADSPQEDTADENGVLQLAVLGIAPDVHAYALAPTAGRVIA